LSYFLELDERTVTPFLEDRERVSEAMQEAIENCLDQHLGQHGDSYCLNESYRIRGTSRLQVSFVLRDPDTGRPRLFRLVLSDAHAQHGVLRVIFIDELTV
jgi:hypothetical protein